MTTPVSVRFEFKYTTVADSIETMFAIGGITEEVAKGIRSGLESVPSITDVIAAEVMEHKEEVILPAKESE
jgi:hypothetical protein